LKTIAAKSIEIFGNVTHRVLMREGIIFHMVGKDATHNFYIGSDIDGKQVLSVDAEALYNTSTEPMGTITEWKEECYIGTYEPKAV